MINPFKPHLVQFGDGRFGIRCYIFDWVHRGWYYLHPGYECNYSTWEHVNSGEGRKVPPLSQCKWGTSAEALKALEELRLRIRKRDTDRKANRLTAVYGNV